MGRQSRILVKSTQAASGALAQCLRPTAALLRFPAASSGGRAGSVPGTWAALRKTHRPRKSQARVQVVFPVAAIWRLNWNRQKLGWRWLRNQSLQTPGRARIRGGFRGPRNRRRLPPRPVGSGRRRNALAALQAPLSDARGAGDLLPGDSCSR